MGKYAGTMPDEGESEHISAVIYACFRPGKDDPDTPSCEEQVAECKKYCRKQLYKIAGVATDPKHTGHAADRDGLWAAIEKLERTNRLVAIRRDRISLDVYFDDIVMYALNARSAVLDLVHPEYDLTEYEEGLRQIIAEWRDFGKITHRMRTKHAMRRRQRRGIKMGADAPYGWNNDPLNHRRQIPNKEEQKGIAMIVELTERGVSGEKICVELESMGFESRSINGWIQPTVLRIYRRQKARELENDLD